MHRKQLGMEHPDRPVAVLMNNQFKIFGHDENGNMTYDGTRNIQIEYNYLNLPQKIGNVVYIYTTIGRKLGRRTI